MSLALDHLVVAARTLDDGVRWCESTLGITPGPGGTHRAMSTHNRLFSIASTRFAKAYLEIIAIDASAAAPGRTRWFDLDSAPLQAALVDGPRLIHWVLRCDDIAVQVERLRRIGLDRGNAISAERDTAEGMLRWRISVRDDGQRLCAGALPTLIEWGERHPADSMPGSGVTLERLRIGGLPDAAAALCAAPGVSFGTGGPPLAATSRRRAGASSCFHLSCEDS